jgi:hypothetical protein
MNENSKRLLIAAGIMLLVFCLCASVAAVGGGLLWLVNRTARIEQSIPTIVVEIPELRPTNTPAQDIVPTITPAVTTTPGIPTDTPPNTETNPSDSISQEIMEQMQEIEDQVTEIRGLQPDGSSFTRVLLSSEQLQDRVLNDFLQDYTPEEAEQDTIILAAFGLLEPGYDLVGLYEELLSEQIAGFYDDETKEMVVVQGQNFGGPERTTYAHEYVHALQDQNYQIREGLRFDEELCEVDTERCAAIQAVLEGDASLTEEAWMFNFATPQDMQELIEFYSSYESPVFDNSPAFLQEDFLFPYLQGRNFVQHFYEMNGWGGVNQLYENTPVSTEQILHPELYPDDQPIPVELPDIASLLGEGWEELDLNSLGEWYTYLLLARGTNPAWQLPDETAEAAAEGWGGDTYTVYFNPQNDQVVLVLSMVWDSIEDTREFATSFRNYADRRFGARLGNGSGTETWESEDGVSLFSVDETRRTTTWIFGPDEATTSAIAAAFAGQ